MKREEQGMHLFLDKPLVSLVVCAYNEAPILEKSLTILCEYMDSLKETYRWEIVLVNDGSRDATGELAETFAKSRHNVHVIHHVANCGLGQALRTAFEHSRGDYIVTLDVDLSYAPDHIPELLNTIRETGAKIVVTSPYMKGGRISNVPWLRRNLSIWANRFLSVAAKSRLSTLTGMVRAYDGPFIRGLNLKSMGMEINTEIVHKATLLHARIEEIPAHLYWRVQPDEEVKRGSSMKVLRHTASVLLSGFLFRPVMFFIGPGITFLMLSLYTNFWLIIRVASKFQALPQQPIFPERINHAVAMAFHEAPHTFIIGGITLLLAIQLISLGIMALLSESYFKELFHLSNTIYQHNQQQGRTTNG